MNISPIHSTNTTQKGKKIGTVAGFGVGSAYVLKNAKDTFINATTVAAGKVGGKAAGYVIAGGICAFAIGATTLAGRTIGSLVDKITQKASQKATKTVLAKSISDYVDKAPTMNLNEFEAMVKEQQDK